MSKLYMESKRNETNIVVGKDATVTHVSQESGIVAQFLSLHSDPFACAPI